MQLYWMPLHLSHREGVDHPPQPQLLIHREVFLFLFDAFYNDNVSNGIVVS
jgi:hypothetical protein